MVNKGVITLAMMVNKGVITLAMMVNKGVITPLSFGKETWDISELDTVRRALKQLPDHE